MEVERITFERTGGFAGMHNVVNINPHDLPEEQAEALSELLDKLDFDELPKQAMNNPSLPDQFTYHITVETKQGEHSLVTGDASAPEEMQGINSVAKSDRAKAGAKKK